MGAAGARAVAMLAAVALVAFVASGRDDLEHWFRAALAGSQDERAVIGDGNCVLGVCAS